MLHWPVPLKQPWRIWLYSRDNHMIETVKKLQWVSINKTSTVERHYNMVQNCKILHKRLLELSQNINQMLAPQKTPHTFP